MSFAPIAADRVQVQNSTPTLDFIALAKESQAVDLAVGFPDYNPPDVFLKNVDGITSGSNPSLNQYTRSHGHSRLVTIMSKLYSKLLCRNVDALNEILITIGASNAFYYAINAYVNPGDEVIIIEPFFYFYEPVIRAAGGICKFIALKLEESKSDQFSSDLKLDFEEFESIFSTKTKLILFNNPNNPSGKVFTIDEMTKIANLAKKYNVLIVSDEVYEWMVYPGKEMIRMATLPGMWDRTVTIGSAGKTFSVTGWRIGWAIAPNVILQHLSKIHHDCLYACPTPLQEAVAKNFEYEFNNLSSPESYFNSLAQNELLPKRNRVAKFMKSVGMKPIIPDGGYFMIADCSNLDVPPDALDDGNGSKDNALVKWLANEKKILGIPVSLFYGAEHKSMAQNYVRFCFFKREETLDMAENNIKKWISGTS